jgi:hypothetical protein
MYDFHVDSIDIVMVRRSDKSDLVGESKMTIMDKFCIGLVVYAYILLFYFVCAQMSKFEKWWLGFGAFMAVCVWLVILFNCLQ